MGCPPSRREIIKAGLVLAASRVLAPGSARADLKPGWLMPHESARHRRTWLAFQARADIWGWKLAKEVKTNLALIANTIARYEPVRMLVGKPDMELVRKICDPRIEFVEAELDDLWLRDYGAVFLTGPKGQLGAVDFNFNGWGEKQAHGRDGLIAGVMARMTGAGQFATELVLEGGGLEVDGLGTAIMTESCILNPNRNKGLTKARAEAELKKLLGLTKIIWLPGQKGVDITDGHIDFYARFVRPGLVVAGLEPDSRMPDYALTREHLKILKSSTDALGHRLEVVTLPGPMTIRPQFASVEFAAGYINYYLVRGAVISPQFGNAKADAAAKKTLARLFPGRKVEQLNIDGLAAGGGGIHCAALQEPLVGF